MSTQVEGTAFQIRSSWAQFCRFLRFVRLEKSITYVFSIPLNIPTPPASKVLTYLESIGYDGFPLSMFHLRPTRVTSYSSLNQASPKAEVIRAERVLCRGYPCSRGQAVGKSARQFPLAGR